MCVCVHTPGLAREGILTHAKNIYMLYNIKSYINRFRESIPRS